MRILFWLAPNPLTKNGMSSKIYKIERKGKLVRAWWGPAIWDAERKRPKPAHPDSLQLKAWAFASVAKAEEFLQKKIAAKKRKGYHQNPRKHA